MCAEILSLMLKKDKDIKGIKIGDTENTVFLFADKTTIMLHGSGQSFESTMNLLSKFANMSGLK